MNGKIFFEKIQEGKHEFRKTFTKCGGAGCRGENG